MRYIDADGHVEENPATFDDKYLDPAFRPVRGFASRSWPICTPAARRWGSSAVPAAGRWPLTPISLPCPATSLPPPPR